MNRLAFYPGDLIGLSGQFGVGKDEMARQFGIPRSSIFKFASPLYSLAGFLTGTKLFDKNAPGARALLQTLGMWGRGYVCPEYPLSVMRALSVFHIRQIYDQGFGHPDFWIDKLMTEIDQFQTRNTDAVCAVTDVRFSNEVARLQRASAKVFHVSCLPDTLAARRARRGDEPGAGVGDVSERFSVDVDSMIWDGVHPGVPVLWNDRPEHCPGYAFMHPNQTHE